MRYLDTQTQNGTALHRCPLPRLSSHSPCRAHIGPPAAHTLAEMTLRTARFAAALIQSSPTTGISTCDFPHTAGAGARLRVPAHWRASAPDGTHTPLESTGEEVRCLIDPLALASNQGPLSEADRKRISRDMPDILATLSAFGLGAQGITIQHLSTRIDEDALADIDPQ